MNAHPVWMYFGESGFDLEALNRYLLKRLDVADLESGASWTFGINSFIADACPIRPVTQPTPAAGRSLSKAGLPQF